MNEYIFIIIFDIIILMNIGSFTIMGIDKRKSQKKKRRIPERTLWILSIVGGSVGILIGMKCFRHKTKHKSFTLGMPLIIIMQLVLIIIYGWLS